MRAMLLQPLLLCDPLGVAEQLDYLHRRPFSWQATTKWTRPRGMVNAQLGQDGDADRRNPLHLGDKSASKPVDGEFLQQPS
jgi:hypothetical protein